MSSPDPAGTTRSGPLRRLRMAFNALRASLRLALWGAHCFGGGLAGLRLALWGAHCFGGGLVGWRLALRGAHCSGGVGCASGHEKWLCREFCGGYYPGCGRTRAGHAAPGPDVPRHPTPQPRHGHSAHLSQNSRKSPRNPRSAATNPMITRSARRSGANPQAPRPPQPPPQPAPAAPQLHPVASRLRRAGPPGPSTAAGAAAAFLTQPPDTTSDKPAAHLKPNWPQTGNT